MNDKSPPVYDQVSTSETSYQQPPSYFNVISQLRAAKHDAKNASDFTRRFITIVCGSCKL